MKALSALIFTIFSTSAIFAGVHSIIIDAGHGGKAYAGSQKARTLSSPNNATSPSGLKEKNLTLELALEIEKQVAKLASKYPKTKIK